MLRTRKIQGFTLIEIAIVMVIIALVAGGIVVGQWVVRNAQLQSIVTDVPRYVNAVTQFQQKYQVLPGDMATATSYWGTNANCASNGVGANPTQTCNGDGNGQTYIFGNVTATNYMERYLLWQHLGNAGFVSGYYTGVSGSVGNNFTSIAGRNIPASSVSGAGYELYYLGNQSGNANFFDNNYGHVLYLGGQIASSTAQAAILTGSEALSIDTKMDDGLPGSGTLYSAQVGAANAGTCATSSTAYRINMGNTKICTLIFMTGF